MENALMVVASVLAAGLIGAGAALGAAKGRFYKWKMLLW